VREKLNRSKTHHKRYSSEAGASFKGLLFGAVFIGCILAGVAYTFGYVVPPGYMGVRKIGMGPGKGFHEKGLAPGYHPGLPFFGYSVVYLVPETVQTLHMLQNSEGEKENTGAGLVVQTTDGVKVQVDVSLLTHFYRKPGVDGELKHGGPADLLQSTGLQKEHWFNRIRRDAEDELKRALGKLSRESFYNPFKREAQVEVAHAKMNERLAPFGVRVDHVLVRRFNYEEDKINDAIFRKNLQVQEERLNQTMRQLAEETAKLEKVSADYDAQIKTLQVQGESEVRIVRSRGDLFEQKQMAKGDLLVAKAKAEVDRLTQNVLANSAGAEIYVARELAPILGSLKGGVVQNLDPYDLEEWVKRLGVTGMFVPSQKGEKSPMVSKLLPQEEVAEVVVEGEGS
jgi:hypothetical protein